MKIIEVKDQIEGGKVAFDILKETLKEGAQTLGDARFRLRTPSSS